MTVNQLIKALNRVVQLDPYRGEMRAVSGDLNPILSLSTEKDANGLVVLALDDRGVRIT